MPKRQRVYATIDLILRNEQIEHEEKILQKL